jgi:hypothetical protein
MYNYSLSFSLDKDMLLSTMLLMMLGIIIASAYTIFIKKYLGEFVLALIDAEAFDKESAKSISDLKIKKGFLRNLVIKKRFSFSPDYFIVEGDEKKYYVNKDYISRLRAKYGNSNITFVHLLITIIAFLAVALILATAVPEFLNMFKF